MAIVSGLDSSSATKSTQPDLEGSGTVALLKHARALGSLPQSDSLKELQA